MDTTLAFCLGSLATLALWMLTSILAHRLSTLQGRGGGQIDIDGQLYQFSRSEIEHIGELIPRELKERMNAQHRRVLRGATLTPAEITAAQQAWQDAARRWLQAHPDRIIQ